MGLLSKLFRRWGGEYFALAAAHQKAALADPEALHTLAKHAFSQGELAEASQWLEKALELVPDDAALWVTRAAVARKNDQLENAREYLERALALQPEHPRALTNLAEIDLIFCRTAEALEKLERALAGEPGLLAARVNRLAAWTELGRHQEACEEGERLIRRYPDHPELFLNTANALLQLGRGRQAVDYLRRALAQRPEFSEAQYLLAVLVGDVASLPPVIDYLEDRLARQGESLSLLTTLANAHQAAGHLSRAKQIARRILKREPEHMSARLVFASCASTSGHSDQADLYYSELFERSGDLTGMASNWLFEGNYQINLSPEALFARHRLWAERYEPPETSPVTVRQDSGKLRIGYVSGDLCRHPVGFLLLDIMRRHDRAHFEPIAFSTTLREDELTRTLKESFTGWHDVFQESDDDLMALIRKERIDVLVDLAGHTAFHRLRVFARRAVPVQVTWLGYFHSTGLSNIDYLLTDPHTSPAELGQLFSETPIWLGPTRFCFTPPPYAAQPTAAPVKRGLPFTFGCFNRLAKLNDEVISVWSEILRRTPGTRLWLKAGALGDAWVRADILERFRAQGIAKERLILQPGSGHGEMLEEFSMVDLALDPFPFTGGATSLEAFWMGVPTLTLPSATMVSRQTHSMLANLGLTEYFSASDARDYIARATAFAKNPTLLIRLRSDLRSRMAESPLNESEGFTHRLETFYKAAFKAAQVAQRLAPYSHF